MWFKRILQSLAPYRPDVKRIEAHANAYQQAFGSPSGIYDSTDGKAPHIDLYVFPPAGERDFVTVVSAGMSEFPMEIPEEFEAAARVELIMGIGAHQNWATNLLKLAAEYPFDNHTYLGVGHTLPFGGELGNGSRLSAFLFVRPRFLPSDLVEFELDGQPIAFLQAVPITSAEHQFAVEGGRHQLESLLEEQGYLVALDVNRPSVI